MMVAGVYTITSPSGGTYVGSAVDFASRWSVHRHHLRKGTHHNIKLQNAAAKYGIASLVFKKLIVCLPEHAVMYEQIAIDALCPRYNVARIAGSTAGYKHTNATKAQFHLRKKAGRSEETRALISAAHKGRRLTDEHRENVAAANRGAKRSDEAKNAMRQAQLGKKQSAETIAKRVAKLKGKPRPPHVVAILHAARDAARKQKAS